VDVLPKVLGEREGPGAPVLRARLAAPGRSGPGRCERRQGCGRPAHAAL